VGGGFELGQVIAKEAHHLQQQQQQQRQPDVCTDCMSMTTKQLSGSVKLGQVLAGEAHHLQHQARNISKSMQTWKDMR
jgi:hypothetical protein